MPRHALAAAAVLAVLAAACGAAGAAPAPSPPAHQSLAGAGWKLSNGEGVNLDVSVPVMALQAMEDAGLVGDPLWRCVCFSVFCFFGHGPPTQRASPPGFGRERQTGRV
jgi:hypothetical protein